MKKISITEAKNRLSALIDGLKGGSSVLIVDRGRPVARLEPVARGVKGDDQDGRLFRLTREGIVRPGRVSLSRVLKEPPPVLEGGGSVVEALLDERRDGR